jgi:hypothetical protein
MSDTALDDPVYSFSTVVPSPERRQSERYTTTMRVGVMLTDAGSELCVVRNISCGGLRARVYSDIKIGTRAEIELKSGQTVSGVVTWCNDQHVGLQFDQAVDVEQVLTSATSAAEGHRARFPRVEVRRFASVRNGARIVRGETVDISQGGVKLIVTETLEAGHVVVSLAGLDPLPGVIRWSNSHHMGIEFNDLIPLDRLVGWSRDGSSAT